MAEETGKMLLIKIENLENGMELAKSVIEPSSERVLIKSGTVITDLLVLNLKRYNVKNVWIKSEISQEVVLQQVKEELNINESLTSLKSVFGEDESELITEVTKETQERISHAADNLLASVYSDDNLLLKMYQLQSYDDYTYKHCLRVAMLTTQIGKQLNMSREDLHELSEAALLHDIGKRQISIDIIRKPAKLTDEEFAEIKNHTVRGYNLLKETGQYSDRLLNAVLMHHEKFDGTGYPLGIKGNQITYFARIIAIADVYDALTSNRPYRKPWSVAEAEEYMMGGSGTHFDYDLIQAFVQTFAPYPVGSVVLLSTGEEATIVSNTKNVLRPIVEICDQYGKCRTVDLYNDFSSLSIGVVKILRYS